MALVGIGVTFIQLGFAAMLTSAVGLSWTALPFVVAGCLLFVWNFFSVPAALDAELGKKIAALEASLANLQKPPPDYGAWRHVDKLTLREAAFLWCDLPPEGSMTSNVRAWYEALASAVRKGELNFEYRPSGRMMDRDADFDYQKDNPDLNTKVERTALQSWAKKHNYNPKFLKDA
jgi:hypothetical protein